MIFDINSIGHALVFNALAKLMQANNMSLEHSLLLANMIGITKELTDSVFSISDLFWNNIGFVIGWF